MDTFNAILTAIATVGFPIVACAALFWFTVKFIIPLVDLMGRISSTLDKIEEKING